MTSGTTPASLHREPWARAVMRLDDTLAPDLSNLAELCDAIPLRVWTDILLDPGASLARAAEYLPTLPAADIQTRTMALADAALLARTADQVSLLLTLAGKPRGGVVEAGAGWGIFARALLKYVPPASLTCVERNASVRDLVPHGPFGDLFRPEQPVVADTEADEPDPEDGSSLAEHEPDDDPIDTEIDTEINTEIDTGIGSEDRAPQEVPAAARVASPAPVDLPGPVDLPAEQSLVFSLSEFLFLDEEAFVSHLRWLTDALAPGGTLVVRTRAPEYWLLPHLDDPDRVAMTRKEGFCHAEQGTTVSARWIADRMADIGLSSPRTEWLPAEPNLTWWAATKLRD